jgi:epoxyqueuosine reductase
MESESDKEKIRAFALRLGFDHCGFATARPLEELREFYSHFIRSGSFATLEYLKKYQEARMDPERILPGIKTVIAVLMNYFPEKPIPEEGNFIISKYAYGTDDHVVVRKRLLELKSFLDQLSPSHKSLTFYDSGPVMEKAWAQRCGVGWQGKNTLLINPEGGSFYHIGIIMTTLDVGPDIPETDHCGSCEKCTKACPTGALDHPYTLDIGRCISYHTIENHDNIPEKIKQEFRDRIVGCDICQDVCPFNRFAVPHREPEFHPKEELVNMRKQDWIHLTQEQFDRLFISSSVNRKGYNTLMRNIGINCEKRC